MKEEDDIVMETAEQKEYLGMLRDLERECCTQERVISELEREIAALGHGGSYREPELRRAGDYSGAILLFSIAAAAVILGMGVSKLFLLWVLAVPSYCAAAMLACLGIWSIGIAAQEKNRADEHYKEEMREYRLNLTRDKVRVSHELKHKALLEKQLAGLKETNRNIRKVLEQLYDREHLRPDCRGFIPVCALYHYLDTGACSKLEDACCRYEEESRTGSLLYAPDEIARQADARCNSLMEDTHRLFHQLDKIHAQGAELERYIDGMQTASELVQYEAACTRQAAEYGNRMMQWKN